MSTAASDVGQRERKAQQRVVALFRNALDYGYLGNWQYEVGKTNLEADLLKANLAARGYDDVLIAKAIERFEREKALASGQNLYEANEAVYRLLRYGVRVSREPGEPPETVYLIDWANPRENHFALAEEVTVQGVHSKRPDVVLYVNGIAIAVLELKRSLVSVSEGIRQNLGNQKAEFIRPFFSTVQLLLAGNDTEGLRYGLIDTPETYWLSWFEETDLTGSPLDVGLQQLCAKERLLEIVHDFMVYDAGVKKTCRHNQYFGVKAAQERVAGREGGIIWHTQGSGKSLTMVWLARWLRETQKDARILIITDRTELDDQIEGVFAGVDEHIYRTKSGSDLIAQVNTSAHALLCSLVHKFGVPAGDGSGEGAGEASEDYLAELEKALPAGFSPKGNLFVFVDECHRTQSGKMHEAMMELLPGAMFIGFTGTPLLKADKRQSIATFGTYIHTYKFDQAVRDKVVLDLRYEARDIDQELTSQAKVDQWFEAKTRGLTDLARAELKRRWGTMQRVLSSRERVAKIANDILMDMDTKERLANGRGNALLVCSSIDEACKFYEMFARSSLKGRVAIVTSYKPSPSDIAKADPGAGLNEKLLRYDIYRQMLADHFAELPDQAMGRIEQFEKQVKERFVKHPGQMRLLIVVDKLLTGFDAPSATYLYIDKDMRDHGLFQAICRVNRLDGEDKDYGYIVDYKRLFGQIKGAVLDYTAKGSPLDGFEPEDVEGLLADRLTKGRQRLEEVLEGVRALCETVEPPKGTLQFQHYFCAAKPGDAEELRANEQKRVALYKQVAELVRAFAAIANEMPEAGFSPTEAGAIRAEVEHYDRVRQEVKLGAGENLDYTAYEADMRYLLDNYIRASESEVVTTFDDQGLIQLIVERGAERAIDALPKGIKKDRQAVAETIENNARKVITDERPINPKYYERMSELLDDLIARRRADAVDYREHLKRLAALAGQLLAPASGDDYPPSVAGAAQRALYDNLGRDEGLALRLDKAIRGALLDGWRGNQMKERRITGAIRQAIEEAESAPPLEPEAILELAKNQREY